MNMGYDNVCVALGTLLSLENPKRFELNRAIDKLDRREGSFRFTTKNKGRHATLNYQGDGIGFVAEFNLDGRRGHWDLYPKGQVVVPASDERTIIARRGADAYALSLPDVSGCATLYTDEEGLVTHIEIPTTADFKLVEGIVAYLFEPAEGIN